MTSIRGPLALLGLAISAIELRAQVVLVPNPYVGSGVYYSHHGRHSSFSLSLGAYNIVPAYYGAPGYNAINQVTVIYTPPPAPLPFVGAGPRVLRLDDLAALDPELRANLPAPRKEQPPDPQLPGGRDAGVFKPLAPDNRDRAVRPPEAPPRPEPQPPRGELPRPGPPDADPKTEGERQLNLGREAFATREYGRAVERFRDAARRTPDEAMPYFLLGQSLFAVGRYPEAVEALRVGVGLRPDWPNARFVALGLYGPNAEVYADHQRRLRLALELLPDDPILLFLYGYQLWFDGKQEAARLLFRRARPGTPDPAVLDRFLAARPAL